MEGILIPQKVFIGDNAEFLYPLDLLVNDSEAGGKSGTALAFGTTDKSAALKTAIQNFKIETISQNSQMTITSIGIKMQDEKEFLAIGLIPYDTGEISFPSLKEAGINKKLPNIEITSILETTNIEILQAPRPPFLIPGTTNLIYITTGIFALSIFLILFIAVTVKNKFLKNSFAKIQRKRIKAFTKKLKKLQRNTKTFSKLKDDKNLFISKWLKEFELALNKYCISIILNSKKILSENQIIESPTYSEILSYLKIEFENSIDIYLEFKDLFLKLQTARFQNPNFIGITSDSNFIHFINKSFYIIKISEEQIEKIKLEGEKNDKIQ